MVDLRFEIIYHRDVKAIDIPLLESKLRKRIRNAIETRLTTAPHQYGEPLRKTLRGYWKLRIGDYRAVYKIVENEVWILGIIHRRDVYEKVGKRRW